MKTVGFIDYFLHEWHADNYPAWIREQSGGRYEVKYAYAAVPPPAGNPVSNEEWAAAQGITLVASLEELIEKSDCIVVLSPDNCEMHYTLSHQALCSGKPVYVDKTFAPTKVEAEKIFAVAEAHGTPCYSSSALRFSSRYAAVDTTDLNAIISLGANSPEIYLIHQLEPVMMLLGYDVEKVMYTGTGAAHVYTLHYGDGRTAVLTLLAGEYGFTLHLNHGTFNETVQADDDFFRAFIDALIRFFDTGEIPVSHAQTVAIMAVRQACLEAMAVPECWHIV